MRNIILAFFLIASTASYAATNAQSIRTSNDFVSVGDSQGSMLSKLGKPKSSYEYTKRNNQGRLMFLTDFTYVVDGITYTVTVNGGDIIQITWER